ncbi:MAG: tyrosine-type recombinase/integrase [Nocardioides sp.]|nr:tyrosine-type recombinase/integrase [Nocardioides sp.]
MSTATRAGNRQRLPANALRACPSCGQQRGTRRTGWHAIVSGAEVVGYTCPTCPTWDEPIRREARGDRVRFVAVVRGSTDAHGKRPQLKRRFGALEDAREWVTETREGVKAADHARKGYSDPSRLTVRVLCERWLSKRREEVGTPGGVREVTVNGYASALHAPLLHMGDAVAREVTPGDVETMLRTLVTVGGKWGRPLSHRSVVYALTALRQAFNYGVREKWLRSNPAALVKPPREQHTAGSKATTSRRWEPEEVKRFRALADTYAEGEAFAAEPWLRAGMRLTLTGMRRSEVLGLDWQRVDLDVGSVEVAASRVKTGRGTATALGEVKAANSLRTIRAEVIHPGTVAALRSLWLAQGRPESGLVIRDAAGQPVDPDLYSARFRALCRSAGLPPLKSIHNVRHTLATALTAAGVPDHEAAALLGHDVQTYRRFYLIADDAGAASAAGVAGQVFAV